MQRHDLLLRSGVRLMSTYNAARLGVTLSLPLGYMPR